MTVFDTVSRKTLALALALVLLPVAGGAQEAVQPPAAAKAADPAPAADPDAVAAKVGDVAITEGDVAQAAEDFGDELQQIPEERRHEVLVNVLVDMELLASAAREKGLDKTPEFERQMGLLRTRALRNEYVRKEIVDSITDADVKAEYDKQVASYEPQDEVHARHILVETEDEAKAIIAELDKGGDFAAIAKEKSKDPGSAENGGDLGFFRKGQMVPAFEEAAFALEPGSYSKAPVKSQFGWHVIEVEEKRKTAPPPLEQVSDQVKTALVRQKFEQTMSDLKARIPVEITGAKDAPEGETGAPDGAAAPAPAKQN
ncbi:peptidylprolyl isomerase [Propylenella binzhouense]|uniref:Parvulin-like PPIase n=1 Tax=Propylenella binzhouense TaxID=2555902 RepID=A0A964T6Y1_9HYPH|nr:peptidylprolyl isomerase [Propylenella binzhouense]MYZ49539.1 peptidylprolyl isomerase [Propylenella binzhouense]